MDADLDVVGIGNALVDVLVEADALAVEAAGLDKGSMSLVSPAQAEHLHDLVGPGVERSGGSAANTMAGLAALGCRVAFIGRVADDRVGQVFARDLETLGIAFSGSSRRGPAVEGLTGRCLVLVTPDADRTMCTSLGVAAELGVADVDGDLVASAAVTYLEGYLFDPPPAKAAFRKAIRIAHGAGRQVAMSLSDLFCVERHREDFAALVSGELDVLFGNADEVCALAGLSDVESACRHLHRPGLVITATLGAAGAIVVDGDGSFVRVGAVPVDAVVDTTGAGDLYAAGFLFGMTQGLDMERCARLGTVTAGEIIGHVGARPDADLAALVAPLMS